MWPQNCTFRCEIAPSDFRAMLALLKMLTSICLATGQIIRNEERRVIAQISSHGQIEIANRSFVQSAASDATVRLPQQCTDWGMSTAEACINKCYEIEVARESAQSEEEMWWGAVGSIFGANVISLQLEDVNKSVSLVGKDQKFITAAIAVVSGIGSVVAGVGSAFIEDEHRQENLNAQNCEQLSAVLMSRKMISIENQLGGINDAISKSIEMIKETNKKVAEVHASVKQMEQQLSNKLHETQVLISTFRLESLMMEFLNCAGFVQHGHSAAQGILSDWQTIKESFKEVAARSNEADSSSLAQEWLNSFKSWEHDLPSRMDPIAARALDGLRCMSNSITNTDLIELYLKDQHKIRMKNEISKNGWSQSSDMMKQLQNVSIETMDEMFTKDEILPLIHASVVQMRLILGLVPREGYWESFALYVSNLNVALAQFLQQDYLFTLATKAFKAGLEEIAPSMFPASEACLTKISEAHPGTNTATAAIWHIDGSTGAVYIVENLGALLIHADSLADPTKGTYFSCGGRKYSSEPMHITYETGRLGVFADDFKAEHILVEQPWTCGIKSINQKGMAVVNYHGCLKTTGQTPFTCRDKLKLTCPSDDTGVYRCSLPGCPKVTMGNKILFECTNFDGALMNFNDHNREQDCDNMCVRLKACGACHHERSGVYGRCRLFPPNHNCHFKYGNQIWTGASYKTVQQR